VVQPPGSALTLELNDALVDALIAAARRAAPREACGLLVGTGSSVVRTVETANAAASATLYAIPPDKHLAAIRAARADGLDVIGAFHSHPHSAAVPSATDTAEAFPDFIFVIVGLAPTPHVRAWRFEAGNFAEVALVRR
jgi:proteasome lid subunit RPN8/RPN11